jgi:DeoR/GlpR family transcriptional regulator of sugar metabolism
MSASERREAIKDILYARRHETIANLATEFDVSVRTIKYDIGWLSDKIPITTKTGRYEGGVYMMEGARSTKEYLHPNEVDLLQKLSGTLSGDDLDTMRDILSRFALKEQLKRA